MSEESEAMEREELAQAEAMLSTASRRYKKAMEASGEKLSEREDLIHTGHPDSREREIEQLREQIASIESPKRVWKKDHTQADRNELLLTLYRNLADEQASRIAFMEGWWVFHFQALHIALDQIYTLTYGGVEDE